MFDLGSQKCKYGDVDFTAFHPVEDGKWSPGSLDLLLGQVIRADQYHVQGNIEPGDVVLDVGASIGLFTWLSCHLGARCHSFEPNPKEYRALRAMIDANSLEAVPRRCAISDEKGMMTLFTGHLHSLGEGEIVDRQDVDENHIKVSTLELDRYVRDEELNDVDLIKIDTEGHEARVLAGAEWTVQAFEPVLVMSEYHREGDPEALEAVVRGMIPDVEVHHTSPDERNIEEVLIAIPASRADRWDPPE